MTTPRSFRSSSRQAWQDLLIDLVFAERRLIPFEAQAPQPTTDIHGGASAQVQRSIIIGTEQRVQASSGLPDSRSRISDQHSGWLHLLNPGIRYGAEHLLKRQSQRQQLSVIAGQCIKFQAHRKTA